MEYQIDTRNHETYEVRVGLNNQEVACFRKANFFIYNLRGEVDGADYQMKMPAPWTGFRYRLRRGRFELASARKHGRMHAFDPDRPLIRHHLVEFELELHGRALVLTPEDRHGLSYVLRENEDQRGRLVMRTFEAQRDGDWEADLEVPDDWSVPLAGFVAWLAREGRSGVES